ncbi:S-layer homology domain-containing protein [Calothrix sp. CCY 0018]|uniref:S-layer homology domain-containing protein n=1 Tax=Calothrix sp. CCY 0018 TaxID=3103864 RepID=UPI0039C69E1D
MSSSKLTMSSVLTVSLLTILSQPIQNAYADEPVEETAETNYKPDTFNDIANHWSRHVINWMAGNNPRSISYLKVSENNFRPGCPITRGEWVAMSSNILDLKNSPSAPGKQVANVPRCPDIPSWRCPFSDIRATESSNPPELFQYYQATFHAWRTGMISGYKNGTFQPSKPLTYTEAIASLNGGLNLVAQIDKRKKQSGEKPSIVGTDYFMNGSVMEDKWFAKPLHGALLANLVVLDLPLEFYPEASLSRGEAAVIMYLVLAYKGQASLDNPILKKEIALSSGEYAFRRIRKAGEVDFSFSPPSFKRQCNN